MVETGRRVNELRRRRQGDAAIGVTHRARRQRSVLRDLPGGNGDAAIIIDLGRYEARGRAQNHLTIGAELKLITECTGEGGIGGIEVATAGHLPGAVGLTLHIHLTVAEREPILVFEAHPTVLPDHRAGRQLIRVELIDIRQESTLIIDLAEELRRGNGQRAITIDDGIGRNRLPLRRSR